MALQVGELYATMRLDDAEFNRGLDGSRTRFEGFRSAVGTGVQAVATGFAAATTVVAGLGLAAAKVGIEYNSLRQTGMAALTTLTGSAEGAVDQMARLDEFGQTSWVMRDVLVQAQTQMMGFGIETEKVIPYLDALQEGVAAVGGSNQDFAELAQIMAQIEGQSKITAEELRMFGMRGIDAAGLIGEAMGYTAEEIRDQITAGTLDATEALDAMAESMMTNFEGATENVLATWSGATSFVAGAWRDLGAELTRPLVDPEGGGYFVDWAMGFSDILYALRDQAEPLVDLLVTRFAPALDSVAPAIQSVVDGISGWDLSGVNAQLDTLSKYAAPIAGVSTALFAMGTTNLPILSQLGFTGINPVVAGLAALVAFSPELRDLGRQALNGLSPLLPVLRDLGVALADQLIAAIEILAPAFGDLLDAVLPVATGMVATLMPAVVGVVETATPLVEIVAEVVRWFSELPDWVIVAGAAFLALRGPLQTVATQAQTMFRSMSEQAAVQAALGGTNQAVGLVGVAARNATGLVRGLGTAMRTAFLSNPVGLAIAGISAALGIFVSRSMDARQRADELRATLDEQTGAITENTNAWAANTAQEEGWLDLADQIGISTQDITDAMLGVPGAMERVEAGLDTITREADAWGGASYYAADGTRVYYTDIVALREGLQNAADETRNAQEETRQLANATGESRRAFAEAAENVEWYNDKLREHIGLTKEAAETNLSQAEATLRQEETQQRANDAVDEYNKVAEDAESTTEDLDRAQRSMEQALIDLARQSHNVTDAMDDNDASAADLNRTIRQQREDFIATAREMGYTQEEAKQLANDYGLIPNRVETTVVASGIGAAGEQINQFIRDHTGRKIYVQVETTGHVSYGHTAGPARLGEAQRWQADGGVWDGKVQTFAAGGIAGDGSAVPRVPQIVQGGANILWGEPETGWEAYISGKPSMRSRNLQILDEAARRLGQMTIPANVTSHADGAVTGPPQVQTQRGAGNFTANIYGVPTNQADETAAVLMRVWRTEQRRGLYAGSGAGA